MSDSQITKFVSGVASGEFSDAQIAAFTMAVSINGLDPGESAALTIAMGHSGDVLAWDEQELGGPVLDKHSSGGVGDKVSIILAPIVAACGGFVPMASGRGLAHTGGTLDKLEAITGYSVVPDPATLRSTVASAGCAIVGASSTWAPADQRIYAVRDVTATTDAMELIVASILSKKIALGVARMVMDIKIGSGAFMADIEAGRELANAMHAVAEPAGIDLCAYLSDMSTPLGRNAGNALEIDECLGALSGEQADPRLLAITLDLAAQMLVQGKLVPDLERGRGEAAGALASGKAAECFGRMVAGLGGASDIFAQRGKLKKAATTMPVHPRSAGVVTSVDVGRVGFAVVDLGAGRRHVTDEIDHGVGFEHMAGVGDQVGAGSDDTPLGIVHARDEAEAMQAAREIAAAYQIGDAADCPPVVLERIP